MLPRRAVITWLLAAAMLTAADWPSAHGDAAMTGASATPLATPLKRIWRVELGAAPGGIAIAGGRIYVGAQDKRLTCLALADGKVLWRHQVDHSISAAPLVSGDLVVVGDEARRLHALEAITGTPRWSVDLGAKICAGANHADGLIIVGSYANDLVAFAASDGSERWRLTTDAQVHAAFAIAGVRGVLAGCDGQARIIDPASGRQLAATDLDNPCGATAAIRSDTALIATLGGTWMAIALADGAIRWRGAAEGQRFLASPAWSATAALLYSQDGALICLDGATGTQRWRKELAGGDASPLICGDQAVVADGGGRIQVLALADGAERWRFTAGAAITAAPALADGRLVVGVSDGALYCFTGKTP